MERDQCAVISTHGSAQNCGCDPGAGHVCEWHLSGQFARTPTVEENSALERDRAHARIRRHGSAQNCGCDPGAGHVCEWHMSGHLAGQSVSKLEPGAINPNRGLPIWNMGDIEASERDRAYRVRVFETGATRDNDNAKVDYEGFLSPLVLARFGQYMMKHRIQADGSVRDSDNWQKGIPKDVYAKSLLRHVFDVWGQRRGMKGNESLEDALCAVMFNAMGLLFEELRGK